MPTANWLTAASKPDAAPIYIYQVPDVSLYLASEPGHYPVGMVGGGDELHHTDSIDKLPTVSRKIQSVFYGRTITAIGAMSLVDNGSFDSKIGDYAATMRGRLLYGWVTFPGLAVSDAVPYLTARIQSVEGRDDAMTLRLTDASTEEWSAPMLAAGTYTSQTLGSVVLARLTAAGLIDPGDIDQTAWNAWIAAGMPGSYTVTGTWSEGRVWDIIDRMMEHTLSWYRIDRTSRKFIIEQFADLGGSPTVDVDLTDTSSLFRGSQWATREPIMRKVTVAYNAGANTLTGTVSVLSSHDWWPGAKEDETRDCGIDGVTDAGYLRDDRLALLSAEHLITEVKADLRMLAYDLGATVKMNFAGKLLPAVTPQYHRVVGIDEDPNNGQTRLTLWTSLGATP